MYAISGIFKKVSKGAMKPLTGKGGVCIARVSGEIEARHRHTQECHGPCETTAAAGHRNRPGAEEIAMPKRERGYTVSSGNVFADLGLPNPEEALAKAELAHKITVLIRDKGMTQVQTAKLLGVDQPKISALIRGRLSGFSLERLMRFLLLLGQDIKITVQACPRSRSQARVHVGPSLRSR
jgi:predicted XRE-type DNA-binding protein